MVYLEERHRRTSTSRIYKQSWKDFSPSSRNVDENFTTSRRTNNHQIHPPTQALQSLQKIGFSVKWLIFLGFLMSYEPQGLTEKGWKIKQENKQKRKNCPWCFFLVNQWRLSVYVIWLTLKKLLIQQKIPCEAGLSVLWPPRDHDHPTQVSELKIYETHYQLFLQRSLMKVNFFNFEKKIKVGQLTPLTNISSLGLAMAYQLKFASRIDVVLVYSIR